MGKWSWLRGKFPTLQNEDPEYDEVLAAARDTYRDKPLAGLVALYEAKRTAKDTIERDLADVNVDITALEQLIDSAMESQSIETAVINGYRYTRKPEPVVRAADKAALLEWAMLHMRDNLSLHTKTLEAVVKRALENHEELPPGVEVKVRQTLGRTKAA